MLDITKIPLDDEATWDLICEGNTKGVFQIESRLGRTWCKKMRPRSIMELSDLNAAIRPGTLKSVERGKSMTQWYSDRKCGKEEVESLYEPIDDITQSTYNVILYQEQSLRIAQKMAGFSKVESNQLRKAIGKKKADLMKEMKEKFISGCLKNNHKQEDAERIFDIIEKSNRYAFNASHSVSYSLVSYWSAYLKAHHPLLFHLHWLKGCGDKPDPQVEMREMVMSARANGIEIRPPSFKRITSSFVIDGPNIRFGVTDVKNVGKRDFEKLTKLKGQATHKWISILVKVLLQCNKRAMTNLIKVGFCDGLKMTRNAMCHELSCCGELSKGEIKWLTENLDNSTSLVDNLRRLAPTKKEGGGTHNPKRSAAVSAIIDRVENPGRSLYDVPEVFAGYEFELFGVTITYSKIESCDEAFLANTTCKEIVDGKCADVIVAAEIANFREHETKDGRKMAFLTIEDETAEFEGCVVFPDNYGECAGALYEGATVLLTGQSRRRQDCNDMSFVIDEVSFI